MADLVVSKKASHPRTEPSPQDQLSQKSEPRFELTFISIETLDGNPQKASRVKIILRNMGELAAKDIEFQLAIWDWRANREPVIIKDSIDVTVESGRGITMQPFPVMIPQYTSDQLVRVWLRYRDADHPDRKPIVQTIFRDWEGTRGGISSPVFNLLTGDHAEDRFNNAFPLPQ
jgi:hypothetical protein